MAISVDPATFIITVPKADLLFVSGTLYEHDTEAFRLELIAWEDDEEGMPFPRTHTHNTEVTIVGLTFSRFIEILSPYSIEYEISGPAHSVRLSGSNNNFFDVENGILVQNAVQVIASNSAGLQTVVSGSGVTQQDKDDIENQIFTRVVENGETFEMMMRLLRAAAAGDIVQQVDGSYVIKSADGAKDRISGEPTVNDGRDIISTDVTE